MNTKFDLNKMGLSEMNHFEMENIDGGYSAYQLGHAIGQWILAMSIGIGWG